MDNELIKDQMRGKLWLCNLLLDHLNENNEEDEDIIETVERIKSHLIDIENYIINTEEYK